MSTELGSVSAPVDRPDQLLDLLNDVINECGLKMGVDVLVGINCAAHEIYDTVS